MKKIQNPEKFFDDLMNTRPVMIALSIICAVLIWFAVSMTAYKTTHVTFNQIPLSTELTGTPAEANGLSVVSCDVTAVNVELEGSRAQIGRLTEEDLHAVIHPGSITSAGEFYFEIEISSDKNINFNASSITPSHATVVLDRIESRTYDVTAAFPNVHVTSGHAMDKEDVTCEPSQIEITGAAGLLDQINRVEVYSEKSLQIDSMYSLNTNEVRLYTDEGALMDSDSLEIPNINFQIIIPVLTQKELSLTYDIRNAPGGFDLDWLRERLHLSEETITLASQTSTVFADRESWNMGFIKLDDIRLDYSTDFIIEPGEEFINQSGFQQVSLTLDSEGLSSRVFQIGKENISVVNAPKAYDYNIITRSMTITVIGEKEELEQLSTQDIIVTVDLLNYDVSQSTSFSADASVAFYDHSKVWAVGGYKIALDFDEKETETTFSTS